MKKRDRDLSIADRIKLFDFYKDLPQDLAEPSVSGATGTHLKFIIFLCLVSLTVIALMCLLLLSQTYQFMQY